MNNFDGNIYLYGPSGSGKSTVGRILAEQLALPYVDLDERIVASAQKTIPDIFATEGETGFRNRESKALDEVINHPPAVVALGGGALLDENNRTLTENSGPVICLMANLETLVERLQLDHNRRPLLEQTGSDNRPNTNTQKTEILRIRLTKLLEEREAHYANFSHQLAMNDLNPEEAAWKIQVDLGRFHIVGMGAGYDACVIQNGLQSMVDLLKERRLNGPVAVVSDNHVASLYGTRLVELLQSGGYFAQLVEIPAGEETKTMETVQYIWNNFLDYGLERTSTVVALGGGVVGDLAGFAAATFLRGIPWMVAPTTLLSMVDASLGGKTGADLPQGKNLVGAFYPPRVVLADPSVLRTLPDVELRSGFAEAVKHGIIGDPQLFKLCANGWSAVLDNLDEIVRRGMAVKIRIIQEDPFEQGAGRPPGRAALNLGHTLGHAIEFASNFRLRHGEAVAIGMVAATRYSERIKLAAPGLAAEIAETLNGLGLPTEIPLGLDRAQVIAAIGVDKKRKAGKVRLALPVCIGDVRTGFELDHLEELLE